MTDVGVDYPFAFSMILLSVGVIGATLAAAKFYWLQLLHAPRHDGLLMWHVVTVGVSVALTWVMLGLGGLDILGIIQTPRWVRLIGYDASGVGTIVAVTLIALLSRRRVQVEAPDAKACPLRADPDPDAAAGEETDLRP